MSVTAPPSPPRPSDPVDREEVEALVEALIEQARQRARRRRRRAAAAATLVALVGVAVCAIVVRSAGSRVGSQAVSARPSAAGQPATLRLAFTSSTRDVINRNVPNPPPRTPVTSGLYVVNADGSGKRLLARRQYLGPPMHAQVAWSPDGQVIATTGPSGLLFVNADGRGQRDVTGELGINQLPIWSPDGRRIAFVRCSRGQLCDIFVMNADGSARRRLTRTAAGWAAFPTWSPNSRQIAFQLDRWSPGPGPKPLSVESQEVWVMNTDGSGQRRLARGFPSAWSPDGKKIAFRGWPKPGLYVMNADGSKQRRLTDTGGGVAWSPDGQQILFHRARPATRARVNDIFVMNADGSGQRKLTERGHDPRWSLDGTRISFVTNRDGNVEIYVINADGSGLVNLSQTPHADESSHGWAPNQ